MRALRASRALLRPLHIQGGIRTDLRPSTTSTHHHAFFGTTSCRPRGSDWENRNHESKKKSKKESKKEKGEKPARRGPFVPASRRPDSRSQITKSVTSLWSYPPEEDDKKTSSPTLPEPDPTDPTSFEDVQARWKAQRELFAAELGRARRGFYSTEMLGRLPVELGSGKKGDNNDGSKSSYPLSELAAVIPRSGGRSVSILVNEADHVKPVMSAVQASNLFNQQPQRDEANELELVLKVQRESPDAIARHLRDVCQKWRDAVRAVSARREDLAKRWKADKAITPDVFHLVRKELLALQQAELEVIRTTEKQEVAKSQS